MRRYRTYRERLREVRRQQFVVSAGLLVLAMAAVAALVIGALRVVQVDVPAAQVGVTSNAAWPPNHFKDYLPNAYLVPGWTRIDTPNGFPLVVRTCVGNDGVYDSQTGGVTVVPDDPACTGK